MTIEKQAFDSMLGENKPTEKAPTDASSMEHALITKYRKTLWSPFIKALGTYQLIGEGDRVAVCISGGKDSMILAKLVQEVQRHGKYNFEAKFLVMDPGYSIENRKRIEDNAARMGIPITIFETEIFDSVVSVEKNPCYLCARMRRGYLYKNAKELGCNKIALGHHFDDVIETTLMGMLYGGQFQTMMPKLHSTNFEGMELIRPLYFVREQDIIRFRDDFALEFLQCACKFTEATKGDDQTLSKRKEIKQLIATLQKTNPYTEQNIFKSTENVNLATILGYKDEGEVHSFLDEYELRGKKSKDKTE